MANIKALVVDDASFVRDLVKRTVRNGFPTIALDEAINGKKAQAMLSRTSYELILCDWEMPEMSGIELLRWVRQQDNYKDVPFVMVTSRGDKSHVVEAIQEGVTDYLGKPFSAEQLSNKIIKALGKKLKGVSPPTSTPLQDAFKQSASILTQAGKKSVAPGLGPEEVSGGQTANSGAASAKSVELKGQNFAEVRFANVTLKCVVKSVSLTEVKVISKRETEFPGILDAAVVDMEFEPGNVARLNGYVHQLQAVEKRQDTDFVSIIIRFVDEDPEKIEHLSKFMARFS
ncbi:MAG: response regulator [Pseudomonadales bacterium]|uniref:Response regulator receiver n=1 Tax=Oleiphilus messinensis TaxID=141451 RepID=A0A1Y0IER8_9GAMM|nr:response regulator [Oleiphilus messinensis]ARU58760.1 response regulator receiver [Oleiphilus messinensis]MCG8612894.1 response regulator [Pseudomonadales bacterium]